MAVFKVFACLLFASNVQRRVRDVQNCSSLNQLWPEMSKLKSAETALNIAENAKISESALKKITEYLRDFIQGRLLNPFLPFQTIENCRRNHMQLRTFQTKLTLRWTKKHIQKFAPQKNWTQTWGCVLF